MSPLFILFIYNLYGWTITKKEGHRLYISPYIANRMWECSMYITQLKEYIDGKRAYPIKDGKRVYPF